MTGGSLVYAASDGPLFYITNSTGNVTLKNVKVTAASGVLVKASRGKLGKQRFKRRSRNPQHGWTEFDRRPGS